jgi:hypothetical protein
MPSPWELGEKARGYKQESMRETHEYMRKRQILDAFTLAELAVKMKRQEAILAAAAKKAAAR